MDVIVAVHAYIEKIVNDPNLDGMKVLLLDEDTTKIISMIFTQSDLLEKEIFLVERLEASHEKMMHMKAALFIRPIAHNIEVLIKELKQPKFGEYHIFFSNIVPHDLLERLAQVDEFEVVRQVQEYYADYLAINRDLFHLNIPNSLQLSLASSGETRMMSPTSAGVFNRTIEGILSVLLSLKKKPVVRYQGRSEASRQLAVEVASRMQRDGLFDFRKTDVAPLLLILDRRDDPVTPLLTQWSFQAMVHELLGLFENRINMKNVPGISKDLEEIVLSMTSDKFFANHMNANFGDLGVAVKGLVDEYQAKAQTHEHIESIEDMQRFVENYPAFRSQSLNVSKHVALMSELARLMQAQKLMDVSQFEQDLSSNDDHSSHYKELLEKLQHGEITPACKLKLAILYALRYEKNSSSQINIVKSILRDSGTRQDKVDLLDFILQYAGADIRSSHDLYGDSKGLKKYMKAVTQGLQGVPNVYAQHVPPLIRTLDLLLKGQLSENSFPFTGGPVRDKPREVIVFITGGVTFEEAEKVSELNKKNPSSRIILGGTFIHNSKSFLDELQGLFDGSVGSDMRPGRSSFSYQGKDL